MNSTDCMKYRNIIDTLKDTEKVWLETNPTHVAYLQQRLSFFGDYQVVGDKVVLGVYHVGEYLGVHADEPLQGGSASLLIYLNDVEDGGETVFYKNDREEYRIKPKEGQAIIFDIHRRHAALPVHKGKKYIFGCEVHLGLCIQIENI
jgi:Rps23 Pro-64 3,4-dihydroxylase Tpa1-like proline 4-hydroxylase